MAVKLNRKGYEHARKLIEQGKVDRDSSWSFSTEDEDKILGDNNWSEYAKWFLAVDDDYDADTKAHYKFPYGKNGKVYRRGVIAAKQRAAQHGYSEIEKAADRLLQLIDKDERSSELEARIRSHVEGRLFTRNFPVSAVVDEEARTVQLSFSSEARVPRWYGDEILLHREGAVDFTPLLEAGSVLRNHDVDQPVGVPLKVWLDTAERKGRAIVHFPEGIEASEQAFREVKAGLIRGVSVGYRILEYRYLDEGESWEEFTGPALVATRWQVAEISLTPVPADATVGVGRSEDLSGGEKMPEKKETLNLEEALRKERERVDEIRRLFRDFRDYIDDADALESRFITEGTPVDEVRKVVLEAVAKKRQPVGPSIQVLEDERDKFRTVAADALLLRAGWKPEKEGTGLEDFASMTLLRLAEECLVRAGIPRPTNKMELVRRAFTETTSDFPHILMDAVNKALQQAYRQVPETYTKWTREVSVSDFKKRYVVRLGSFADLELVPEGGEFKEKTFSDEAEEYSIATYGAIFSITRQAIINDDLDAFSRIPRLMGAAAKRTIERTVYGVLVKNPTMGDGKPLFSTAHRNVASTAGTINDTTLKEMRTLMGKQKDPDGNLIYIRPGYIIVPPALYTDAAIWMKSTVYPGKSNNQPNIWQNWAEVIETPYISADAGGSDTAWYVVADPNYVDTVEVAFLNGQKEPTVETERGFEVDGMRFKVRIDFGAAPIDWRGLYKNPGA